MCLFYFTLINSLLVFDYICYIWINLWDDVNALYAEVMKIEGFDEITLGDAFNHLVQNEMMAKTFMAKNANLRKIWVQNFMNQHYYRPAC